MAATTAGWVFVWDIRTGASKEFQLQDGAKKTMITYCIAFAADGNAVVTGHETGNTGAVLDGDIDGFIEAYLKQKLNRKESAK